MSDELSDLRGEIDKLDEQLMQVLGKRFAVTKKVGIYKRDNNVVSQDHGREARQMERISELAKQNGVSPEYAKRLLRMTIDEVIANHKALREEIKQSEQNI
ncbi:chorismate mutase [Candidatus Saccharibacteria bacterium]|nr:MAG: chorismate mutase [Candidatus Saccharibacteria bacterium]